MSTKTKRSAMDNNPFGALDMIDGQVIIQGATASVITDADREEAAKQAAPKKKAATKTVKPVKVEQKEAAANNAEPAAQQETAQPKTETFEEVVKGLIDREAAVEAAEAALKEKEERLAKAEALLKQAANEQLKQEEKKMAEEAKKNEVETKEPSFEEMMAEVKKQYAELKPSVKVETEDYWTTAKKSFVTGAAAAGGALTVIGLVKLASCLLGGGSSD